MGRVLTNGTTLSFAQEATLGVLPATPAWKQIEPNAINTFGTTITKEARSPISRARARRKGAVTDLESAVEVEADLTLAHLSEFAAQFLFAVPTGGDVYEPTGATVTGYTVPLLSAAQAGRILYSSSGAGAVTLVHAHGFANAANNGIKPVSNAGAALGTEIKVAGLTAETLAASAYGELAIAGVRGAAGDIEIDAQGNIISTTLDFTTLGLAPGQIIHVGGAETANQFFNEENSGFVRVRTIAAHKLTIDKRDQAFVTDDGTSTGAGGSDLRIDLLFGQFIKNYAVGDDGYVERSVQFELASPNLMTGGATGYEYAKGNYANALSIAIPLTGKATVTLGFVGTDTTKPSEDRAAEAENAKVGGRIESFGSASDIVRLRAQDVDEAGLTTDFKTATLTLTNNVTGEKVIGQLGPKYLNAGMLECDLETQLLFTNPDMIERIRCNRTVGIDFVIWNGDGGAAFDLPTGTLNGGAREFPVNESVLMNCTFMAHEEDNHGYTCGISFFPFLPARPCA